MPLAQIADLLASESGLGENATGGAPLPGKLRGDEGETMEIIRHLSNEELTDLTIESDQRSLRPTLEGLPEWARSFDRGKLRNSGRRREALSGRVFLLLRAQLRLGWFAAHRFWHGRPR